MYVIVFLISFFASVIGAICGIGGGVIIKPVLDAVGVFSVSAASFLSGCTVLAMSGYSVLRNLASGKSDIDLQRGTFLGVGAALGGVTGKALFEQVKSCFTNANTVGAVQAAALFLITGATLLYTLKKAQIRTLDVQNRLVCVTVGLTLGIMSSFLGIGGGPINLVVLYYFFSMSTKTAAQNSLYIILLSQLSSLLMTLATHSVPAFSCPVLIGMVGLGILGGATGRVINRRIHTVLVDRLFLGLLLLIMGICVYNICRYV